MIFTMRYRLLDKNLKKKLRYLTGLFVFNIQAIKGIVSRKQKIERAVAPTISEG